MSSTTRWIDHWDPEDTAFWETTGKRVARRNLIFSILTEHIGFSIWSLWSVMVLFMTPEQGFTLDAGEKFLLVSCATLVGALVRLPYTFAVPRFGGRNWTVFSAAVLLIPTVLTAVFMQRPDTSFATFLVLAAITGLGGGNFASSMANISFFYPERQQGTALGLNAAGGNLGVPAVQLVGLFVIAFVGQTSPAVVAMVYLPLLIVAVTCAALFMDNLTSARSDVAAQLAVVRDRHTWVMSFLYIGTFGSFIGYSFAFGLVLQTQFGFTPLAAASLTFLGPLLGSLSRPLGGWLADRRGGALVTFRTFVGMALATLGILAAAPSESLPVFLAGFIALFVLSGIGNGSTYKMIPTIFAAQARTAVDAGADPAEAQRTSRRLAAALIGIAGAVGALGGVFINVAFRFSFASYGTGTAAFVGFLAFYALCVAVTWRVYLRRPVAATEVARPVLQGM
ncbi:MAG: NarK/NasA family nitrate transporter [Actinomycetota bacterium]|nr:NarK/NasA family nitrate transporter [Actinomycetota bacterium]